MKLKISINNFYKQIMMINIICVLSIANATESLGHIQTLFLGVSKVVIIILIMLSLIYFTRISKCCISLLSCIILPSAIYILIRCIFNNYGFSVSSYIIVILLYFSCIIFFHYNGEYNKILDACIIGGYALVFYLILSYGGIGSFLRSIQSDAIANVIVQKNILAYSMAIVVLICVYRLVYQKNKIYFLLAILPTIVTFGTGSRRGILAIVISITVLYILKDFNYKVLINILMIICLIYIFYIILKQMNMLYLTERLESLFSILSNEGDMIASDQGRMNMIEYGWHMFLQNPVFGNGANAFKELSGYNIYSHNNFIELLANFGIVGFILYYGVYVAIISKLIKIAKTGDMFSKLLLSYFIMRIVTDYGNVSYYDRFTYIMIATGISYILKKSRCKYD